MASVFTKSSLSILGKVKLLVIDSDARNVDLMANVLTSLGFPNVYKATDGFEAVETIKSKKIDLAITDWELKPIPERAWESIPENDLIKSERWSPIPPTDGANFVRYLRSSKYSPNPYLPVIMITGHALRNNIEYARDSGVDEILLKPITAEKLCSRIALVVDHKVPFITSPNYRGPCRRRKSVAIDPAQDRRKHNVMIIKHQGS